MCPMVYGVFVPFLCSVFLCRFCGPLCLCFLRRLHVRCVNASLRSSAVSMFRLACVPCLCVLSRVCAIVSVIRLVSVSPCVHSTMSFFHFEFHHLCVQPCVYSTVCVFYPLCQHTTMPSFHCVCSSPHLYSTVSIFSHVYVQSCLCYVPQPKNALWSAVSVFRYFLSKASVYFALLAIHRVYVCCTESYYP